MASHLRVRSLLLPLPVNQSSDANGFVPHSKEWFNHWELRIDRVIAGEDSGELRGMPLEVVDFIIEAATQSRVCPEGNR